MVAATDETLVEINNLKMYFPVTQGIIFQKKIADVKAVDGVSFNIKKGETLGLVGESGSGKTTAGRSILHLIKPTSGSVKFEGEEVTEMKGSQLRAMRRKMQIIFQDPYGSLNPRMSCGDIVGEPLKIHGLTSSKQEYNKRVAELLEICGLSSYMASRYPHEFSGGQRQRIGIARALAVDPSFIVCDEPVSALDVSIQAQVINLIKDIIKEYQMGVIFITHDLGVIAQVADHVAVMYLGSVVEKGPVNEILKNPKHPYTKGLLQALPDINNLDAPLSPIPGNIPSPLDRPTGCVFRTRCPHHNPEGKDGKIEMKLIEVEPGHWVDQCGIQCGQNG